MKYLGEQALTTLISLIKADLAKKLVKPTTDGTDGQILSLSGGATSWIDKPESTATILRKWTAEDVSGG